MSVPTHNLYDFVHQVTKRKFFLLYFNPWGSRDLRHLCHYQLNDNFLNGPNGIPIHNRYKLKNIPQISVDQKLIAYIQPVLLCHDQEPLNFDLYDANGEYAQVFYDHFYHTTKLGVSPHARKLNIRLTHPGSLQKKWILLHSELNSPEVEKYNSTGVFQDAYWWSHAIIARDWYRFAEYDQSIDTNSSYQKLFLTYCRATTGSRTYRQEFLEQLSAQGIDKHCQFRSFHNHEIDSSASAVYESDDINRTAISVVLETIFDNRIHLTEKILRPIACGHPFILAAGPGSLSVLRKYGFKTFSPWIDESYDNIIDPQQRLAAITNEMARISQLSEDQQKYIIDYCRGLADFNQQRFFSSEFISQVIDELYNNVESAYAVHQGDLDTELWWRERRWRRSSGPPLESGDESFSRYFIPLCRQNRLNTKIC